MWLLDGMDIDALVVRDGVQVQFALAHAAVCCVVVGGVGWAGLWVCLSEWP
jgi:hypothetical protein